MPDLTPLPIGGRLTSLPGRTWEKLLAGERRDRQRGRAPTSDVPTEARSPFLVRLKWTGEATLPVGNVVKLGDALLDPTDSPAAPFSGLQFECSAPEEGDGSVNIAITLAPIPAGGIGYGHLMGGCWARVNVVDTEHKAATVVEGTVLDSSAAGKIRILWQQSGTGEKWAKILINPAKGEDEVVQALLVKNMEPALADGAAGTLTPSAVVEAAVMVLANPAEGDGPATATTDDDNQIIRYDAVNRAWLRELTAGDGAEQMDEEEPPAGTGVYNATPKIVYGYITTRTVTAGEGEEATEEKRDLFVITDVQNPPRFFRGETTAPVAGGAWSQSNGELLWGDPLPGATISNVDNPDDWEGDGYALGMERPDGTNAGLDLACPDGA